MRFGWMLLCGFLIAGPAMPGAAQRASPPREIAYGTHALQRLDFHPASDKSAPLVVFVHGGAWSRGDKGNATGAAKIAHFPAGGLRLRIGRLSPRPPGAVQDQAQDVADALGYLIGEAGALRNRPAPDHPDGPQRRRAFVGAGGDLPAISATRRAGLDAIAGVVLLDGAAVHPRDHGAAGGCRVVHAGPLSRAPGTDPGLQRALSPTAHAAAPNAPAFLILHIDRDDARYQSGELARALGRAGVRVQLEAVAGQGLRGHMAINRSLGDSGYEATPIVDAWIDLTLGKPADAERRRRHYG